MNDVGAGNGKRMAFIATAAVLLTGCAAGPNQLVGSVAADGGVAGFWNGLWHGLIAPIAFIISLFNANVGVYEVHNNGSWYTFGFLIGMCIAFGGGGHGSGRRKRRS